MIPHVIKYVSEYFRGKKYWDFPMHKPSIRNPNSKMFRFDT